MASRQYSAALCTAASRAVGCNKIVTNLLTTLGIDGLNISRKNIILLKKLLMVLKYPDFKKFASICVMLKDELVIDYKLIVQLVSDNQFLSNEISENEEFIKKINYANIFFKDKVKSPQLYNCLLKDFSTITDLSKGIEFNTSIDTFKSIGRDTIGILNGIFNTNQDIDIEVFTVENFPVPYNEITTWDFMYADQSDFTNYGINPGLYISSSRQFPIFCEYLIIHEYVHHFMHKLKKTKEEVIYRWIEEGLANFFAFVVHFELFKNKELLKFCNEVNNLFISIYPYSTIHEYSKYDNLIKSYYRIKGRDAIIGLVLDYCANPNSDKWRELMFDIINGELTQPESINTFSDIHFILSGSIPVNNSLSLTAGLYKVIEVIDKENLTIPEIIARSGLSEDQVQKLVNHLKGRGFLLEVENKIGIVDNVKHYLTDTLLKVTQA